MTGRNWSSGARWAAVFLVVWGAALSGFAQDDEETDARGCPVITDKKAVKYYEAGTDRRKYGKVERLENLRKAIEQAPEYADAYLALGIELVKTAKAKGSSFKSAEKNFQQAIAICPDVHYDAYYYLASIALGRNGFSEAVTYYAKYFELTLETDDRLSERREAEIQSDFEYANFFHEAYSNPVPFDPELVANVSTADDEYLPLITPDNESMYFTRRFERASAARASYIQKDTKEFDERFSISGQTGRDFATGASMPEPFNTDDRLNYGGATISLDNKHIFVTICRPLSNGYTNCDIFTADWVYGENKRTGKTEFHWTELRNLGENVNGKDSWESQPSLSADGNRLYFASAREDSKGIDIYYTDKQNGVWQKAQNLGPPVNTEGNDKTPFMHSDSRTLYFSSDGHLGFGGYDVFFAKFDEAGNWEKPTNIGYPINSEEDEHGFVVSTDGRSVYFASDKLKDKGGVGGLDIFRFALHEKARPDEVVFLSGAITDQGGDPIQDSRIEVKNMKTKEVREIKVDSIDGRYAAVVRVEEDADFVVNVKAKDMAFNSHFIPSKQSLEKIKETERTYETRTRDNDLDPNRDGKDIDEVVEDTYFKIDAKLEKVEVGGIYRLHNIYYATNSAEITEGSKNVLREFAVYLKENPSMKVDIHGHTDDVGDAQENLVLSTDRAFSVMAFLQEEGVSSQRLAFKGFGETNPYTSNATAAGRAQNRRTEFRIVSR